MRLVGWFIWIYDDARTYTNPKLLFLWRPCAITGFPFQFLCFYSLNFVSPFPVGSLLTLLPSNRSFKVKTLNPVSSLATDDLTFATSAVACVNPIRAYGRFFFNVPIPFRTRATVINARDLVVYFTTLAVTGYIAWNGVMIDKWWAGKICKLLLCNRCSVSELSGGTQKDDKKPLVTSHVPTKYRTMHFPYTSSRLFV